MHAAGQLRTAVQEHYVDNNDKGYAVEKTDGQQQVVSWSAKQQPGLQHTCMHMLNLLRSTDQRRDGEK